MNIKQMVFASYIEEDIEYRWIVYDADNLDTPPLFSGGGAQRKRLWRMGRWSMRVFVRRWEWIWCGGPIEAIPLMAQGLQGRAGSISIPILLLPYNIAIREREEENDKPKRTQRTNQCYTRMSSAHLFQ